MAESSTPPLSPAHVALAAVFQVRDAHLPFPGSGRASRIPERGRFPAARSPPTRRSSARSSVTSRRRWTCATCRTSSSSARGATQRAIPSAGSSRPPTSGSSPWGSIRACPPTRTGTRSTRCPRRRSTTARSCSQDAIACVENSRTLHRIGPAPDCSLRRAPRRLRGGNRIRGLGDDLKRVLPRRGAIEAVGKRRAAAPPAGDREPDGSTAPRGDGPVRRLPPARIVRARPPKGRSYAAACVTGTQVGLLESDQLDMRHFRTWPCSSDWRVRG